MIGLVILDLLTLLVAVCGLLISPVLVRRYTRHAIMLTSARNGSFASDFRGIGTPG